MNMHRRRLRRLDPRRGDAPGDRYLVAAEGREVQRVGGRLLDTHIAEGGRDAHQIDGGMGQREVQRHCVVHTRIGVIDNLGPGRGLLGHVGEV